MFKTLAAAAFLTLTVIVFAKSSSTLDAAFPGANGKVVFTRDLGFKEQIWTAQSDGSDQQQLTNTGGDNFTPTWSPSGSEIAFESSRDGSAEIYKMNADGTNQTRLTNSSIGNFFPEWSPGGAQIAFMSSGGAGFSEAWTMDSDGSSQSLITSNAYRPTWTGDGSRIRFFSYRSGTWGLYSVLPDGSNEQTIASSAEQLLAGQWSPDGTKVVYAAEPQHGELIQLYVANADGSDATQVTYAPSTSGPSPSPESFVHHHFPDWSPDGQYIVYTRLQNDSSNAGELWAIHTDGSDDHRITSLPSRDDHADWQAVAHGVGGAVDIRTPEHGQARNTLLALVAAIAALSATIAAAVYARRSVFG